MKETKSGGNQLRERALQRKQTEFTYHEDSNILGMAIGFIVCCFCSVLDNSVRKKIFYSLISLMLLTMQFYLFFISTFEQKITHSQLHL